MSSLSDPQETSVIWSTANIKVCIVQINYHTPILWLQGNKNIFVFLRAKEIEGINIFISRTDSIKTYLFSEF